ncbi:hypothetical protein [Streptomyces chartreusis]|uniref:hypothetical protein n=1 Tax=Streptomyces chartreusis TaxID=1969 RepID=UPI00382E9D88
MSATSTPDADVRAYRAVLAAHALLDDVTATPARPPAQDPAALLTGTLLRQLLHADLPALAVTHPDCARACHTALRAHATHTGAPTAG